MAKEIVPHKLIIDLNQDGSFRDGVLQYRIRVDGATQEKYFTMGLKNGVNGLNLQTLIDEAKSHTEKGEKIK